MTSRKWESLSRKYDLDKAHATEVALKGKVMLLGEIEDDQASYGIAQFEDLRDVLQDLNVAYHAYDEGKYEITGKRVRWVPGMDGEHWNANDATDGAFVSETVFNGILESYATAEEQIAALRRRFGHGIVPDPHPTDAAFEAAAGQEQKLRDAVKAS